MTLGYVKRPGQYLVPRHTDLLSLISFAGGFIPGADLENVRIMRNPDSDGNEKTHNDKPGKHQIRTVSIKKYFHKGLTENIPTLEAGDSILIPQSGGDKFKNFMGFNGLVGIIVSTATIIIAIDRIK